MRYPCSQEILGVACDDVNSPGVKCMTFLEAYS